MVRLKRNPYGYGRHRCQGFTLTEVALVLGITALVLAGIFMAAEAAQKKTVVNQIAEQIGIIYTNVQSFYNSQNPAGVQNVTAAIATPSFVQQKVFPNEMLSTGMPTNIWGGAVTLALLAPTAAAPAQFIIEYDGVPGDICRNLLPESSTPGRETGLLQIKVLDSSGNLLKSFLYSTHDLPIMGMTAVSACPGSQNTNYNLQWYYQIGNGCLPGTPC